MVLTTEKPGVAGRLVAVAIVGVEANKGNTPRGVRGQTKVTGEANTTGGVNDHTYICHQTLTSTTDTPKAGV